MDSLQLLVRMKDFVRSSDSPSTSKVLIDKLKQAPKAAFVSGTDIKQFYEKTLGKEALDTTHKTKCKEEKLVENSKQSTRALNFPVNVNLLMKAVETGNTKDVVKILETNKEGVNCCDQFGWTPLMSACCAGNRPMVQLLLRWKPDLSVSDKRGNTCRVLATAGGHHTIVDILNQYSQNMGKTPISVRHKTFDNGSSSDLSAFYCEVCKQNVENTSLKKHLSSTVHNFHAASKRKIPTMYGIPESNKGFQILVKAGWNKDEGLGPCGMGHKYPLKTILKQDRTGLGAKRYKARVTHSLQDTRRQVNPKNKFKRDLKSEKRQEQRLERNIRRMLS